MTDSSIVTDLNLPDNTNEVIKVLHIYSMGSLKIPDDAHTCKYLGLPIFHIGHLMGVERFLLPASNCIFPKLNAFCKLIPHRNKLMLGILEPTFHVAPGMVVHVLCGMRPLNCYFALFIMCFDDHFKFRRQQCVSLLFTVDGAVYNLRSQFIVIQMYEGIVLYLSEILLSQNVT